MTKEELQDKIRGSLVGGAVGDALGYPVEFVCSFEEIRAKYGRDG
ncbi:MAG: ADP-ribosylglycohydrolase family protein, partial [Paramuribaculum sp.]|nr:ADP-ribosylglycohydrolase family protein [Paramuribaculum sp.]